MLCGRRTGTIFLRTRRLCTSAADAGIAQLRRQEAFVSAKTATQAIAKPARTALERYAELLQERPLLTNAVTSGVLCALGDVLAQLVEWRVGAKDSSSRQQAAAAPPVPARRCASARAVGTASHCRRHPGRSRSWGSGCASTRCPSETCLWSCVRPESRTSPGRRCTGCTTYCRRRRAAAPRSTLP